MSLSMMPGPASLRLLAAALIVAGSMLAAPQATHAQAQAQPPAEQQDDPGTLAREAIDKLMRALSSAIQNLPQYAMPELNERGDIIIRRINPRADKPPRSDNPDETRT